MTQTYAAFEKRLAEIAVGPSQVVGLKDIMRIAAIGVGTMSDSAGLGDTIDTAKLGNQATDGASMAIAPTRSRYGLGQGSLKELVGVDARLVTCVKRAIQLTTQDFCVYDGIRSVKEQQAYVAKGTSKTMASKHLDGLAVDLVPWVNGKPVWDWDRIYPIAYAMDLAATEMEIAHLIRWGGAWDRKLSDFGGTIQAYQREVEAYASRHPGKDFLDGPHFEISRGA